MKKLFLLLTVFLLGIVFTVGAASAYLINDNYIGGNPTSSKYLGKDVIGQESHYDVLGMNVSFSNNEMVVDIYSRYFNNIGSDGTRLGDLFISTDGYNPASPTSSDNYRNGEDWEYAVVLDRHNTTGGSFNIYSTDLGRTILSSAPPNYSYRADQEVLFSPGQGAASLGGGVWAISFNGTTGDTDDFLRLSIPMLPEWQNVSEFGYHWGMTCGNDVVEGAAPTPEPATMLLLGSGLAGLAGLRTRRRKSPKLHGRYGDGAPQ